MTTVQATPRNPTTPVQLLQELEQLFCLPQTTRSMWREGFLDAWAKIREQVAREVLVRSAGEISAIDPAPLQHPHCKALAEEAFRVADAFLAEAVRARWEDLALSGELRRLREKAGAS